MTDIALTWSNTAGAADFSISQNDLATDGGFSTTVYLSLFTNRRAEPGDVLPDGETDMQGWWADTAEDKIGSRLWLLARSKETQETLDRAEEYAREALAWLLTDRVSDRVDVTTFYPRRGMLGIEVVIHRPKTDPVQYRYEYNWASQQARSV